MKSRRETPARWSCLNMMSPPSKKPCYQGWINN
jgi:hypothetical protein